MQEKKFNYIIDQHLEKTHRLGWGFVSNILQEFHNPQGIACYAWLDKIFKSDKILCHPWCGFLHNVVSYPVEYPQKYTQKILPLKELVLKKSFQDSLKKCRGIFTLAKHSKDFLDCFIDVPIISLYHPSHKFEHQFNMEQFVLKKTVVHIGQWMRKYHSFLDIDISLQKIFIKVEGFESDYEEMLFYSKKGTKNIQFLNRLSNFEYDKLITSSVVFLDLYDVCACNTVIECIMMSVPVLTRRLPANEEYLGKTYPFFFENLEEAKLKIENIELIYSTHKYLQMMDKQHLTKEYFCKSIMDSAIFKKIPYYKI